MDQLNVDDLKITNVSHEQTTFFKNFIIRFEIDGIEYRLHTEGSTAGTVYPFNIIHQSEDNDCNYCDKSSKQCRALSKYQDELFHRLIEHPSIRLEWLYIHHV